MAEAASKRSSVMSTLVIAVAFGAVTARAHHSIAAVYDSTRQVRMEGFVTEFKFVNPHPSLVLQVDLESGEKEVWELEMDNRSELAAIGVKQSTFRPGDRVAVRGSVARKLPHRLYLLELDRPADGLHYEQVGTRPSIEPRRGR